MADERVPELPNGDPLAAARQFEAEAKVLAEDLKKQAGEAEAVHGLWSDIVRYREKGWDEHLAAAMEAKASTIQNLRKAGHPGWRIIEEIGLATSASLRSLRIQFPELFHKACIARELEIDRDSRHPKYTFWGHLLEVAIDDRRGLAKIKIGETSLGELPADHEAVAEKVSEEHKRLFKRAYDGKSLLKKIYKHYCALASTAHKAVGEAIPIRDLTSRFGKNEKGFRVDEFIVDLSRLVTDGPLEVEGYRLDLQQTKDTNKGILLLGPAGRGYVGFVLFRKVS